MLPDWEERKAESGSVAYQRQIGALSLLVTSGHGGMPAQWSIMSEDGSVIRSGAERGASSARVAASRAARVLAGRTVQP